MRKLPLVLALLAVAALAAALAIPALAATRTVSLHDNYFSPKATTVSKGTKVRFVWRGEAPHNVTKTKGPGKKFRSANKQSGTFSRTFTTSGSYTIVCTIHPGMTLKLRVK
jgi:plastocyanin